MKVARTNPQVAFGSSFSKLRTSSAISSQIMGMRHQVTSGPAGNYQIVAWRYAAGSRSERVGRQRFFQLRESRFGWVCFTSVARR